MLKKKKTSRTRSSILNFLTAMIGQFLGLIVSFIARIFFVKILGSEYLGLNGLFTNILTVLSLAELGVGTAITYSLYKPLADNDIRTCKMLMQLYKKVYTIIGIIILFVGTLITPLLPMLIKDMPNIPNINLIYILFVINTAISYFYSYKRNLIIADQNRYIATIYRYSFYIILNVTQIIYLVFKHNYIGFLVLQIIATLSENIFISKHANKMYPFLNEKEKIPLEEKTKKEIIKNTKAMMMHKIGGTVVSSTDNILISSFIGILTVGIYSNYYLVLSAINTICNQIYNSMTASLGNMWVKDGKEKNYNMFKNINFLTFWLYCFICVCLTCLFNPFIELWLGKKYLFGIEIVLILVTNLYLTGMRKSVLVFRDATGLFYKDRYKAVIEAIINLVASIILAKYLGVFGVFLGTFISSITTCVWVEPYVLYKYGFEKSLWSYFKDYFKKTLLTIILVILTYFICNITMGNVYLSFLIKSLICLIIPNVVLLLIYRKTEEFKYFYNKLILKFIKKIKHTN